MLDQDLFENKIKKIESFSNEEYCKQNGAQTLQSNYYISVLSAKRNPDLLLPSGIFLPGN